MATSATGDDTLVVTSSESPCSDEREGGERGREFWSRFCDGVTLTIIQFLLLLWKNFILQVHTIYS